MTAISLSCRVCATEHPLEAIGTCRTCFGPLDPVYDWDLLRATVTRERLASGPPSLWRYADLLPVDAPNEPRLAPGLTPLVPAPRLAEEIGVGELWLKLDTANPTHSFKDRVVAVAARKAQDLGLRTLSCSSTGNLAGAVAARAAAEGMEAAVFVPADLEPEKLAAAAVYGPTIYAVDGHYDHCSRLSVELSFELPWGFVNVNLRSYYAEGSKTLAYELAEQLGWRAPDVVADPDRLGRALPQGRPGILGAPRARPARRPRTAADRRAGGGLPAGRDGVPRGQAGHAGAARLDRPLPRDRQPGRRRLRRRHRRETGGAIHAVPENAVGENMALLARTTGVFGETATGVTLGALRAAVQAGEVDRDDRVVLLVTGDGLKTLAPVSFTYKPEHITADADAFLDARQAAA